MNRQHQVLTNRPVKNQEWITLWSLLAREEWYIVYFLFSPVRWPSEQVDRAITAGTQHICKALWQLIIHTLPCFSVYQGSSQTSLVLLWHRKQRWVFLRLPPTPQSPAVLLCWRDMHCTHAVIYTYTIVHFKFCFLSLYCHRGLINYWNIFNASCQQELTIHIWL